MKRFLFILILLTGKAYGQRSAITDTICFPIEVIRRVLVAAEQKKNLELQVVILNQRIVEKDSIVNLLKLNRETIVQIIDTYEKEIATMKDQRTVWEKQIKENEKIIRKLKRKVFWASAAGVAGVGVMAYLLITK